MLYVCDGRQQSMADFFFEESFFSFIWGPGIVFIFSLIYFVVVGFSVIDSSARGPEPTTRRWYCQVWSGKDVVGVFGGRAGWRRRLVRAGPTERESAVVGWMVYAALICTHAGFGFQ